jgi:NAD-dependent dihydropyrimidine dehydrogenase PreA subunit
MIEVLSESRCTSCNLCVRVCPTNVFEAVEGGPPVVARQSDCQTCFMCELYCPTDALYVAPDADELQHTLEPAVVSSGALGSYRAAVGWGSGRLPTARADASYRLLGPGSGPSAMGAALPGSESGDAAASGAPR